MIWNTDISQAPRGHMVETTVKTKDGTRPGSRFVPTRVILSTKCGKATLSQYVPNEERWLMLGKGDEPTAWMPWPEPYCDPSDGHVGRAA